MVDDVIVELVEGGVFEEDDWGCYFLVAGSLSEVRLGGVDGVDLAGGLGC